MKVFFVAFLDVLFCMLMLIILMVNPVKDPEDVLQPPGNLFVYTTWADSGNKNDVDIWMMTPKMPKPLGYDNKESGPCNLVKDDLGSAGTHEGNYENVYCRDVPDGEYAVNLHAFEVTEFPMQVNVQISMLVDGRVQVLFEEKVILEKYKDEKVVIRWKMKDGKVIPGSVNHVFVSLFQMR